MNLVETLKTKYRSIDPIFDTDIYGLGYTDADIEESLKENVFEEVKVDTSLGVKCKVYTLVDYDGLFDMYTKVNSKDEQIVIKYYIGENYEYGYFTGLTLYNKLGISTQVPNICYIASSRIDKDTEIPGFCITALKKYNSSDVYYIYLSTLINNYDKVEYKTNNIIENLKKNIKDLPKLKNMVDISRRYIVDELFA